MSTLNKTERTGAGLAGGPLMVYDTLTVHDGHSRR